MAEEPSGRVDRWRNLAKPPIGQESLHPEDEPEADASVDDDLFDEPGDPRQYVAYRTKDRVPGLQIRRVLGAWHHPYYPFLLDMSCDAQFGTTFVLFYNFYLVQVDGRNLQEIIKAIHDKRCAFIQDFHPEEHDEPEEGKPVITAIRIVNKAGPDAMTEVDTRHTDQVLNTRTRGGD